MERDQGWRNAQLNSRTISVTRMAADQKKSRHGGENHACQGLPRVAAEESAGQENHLHYLNAYRDALSQSSETAVT
jgi:hypothetical protein